MECGALGTELEGAFETPFIRGARLVIHSEEGRAPDPWISSCCSASEDPLLPWLSPSGSKARRCRDDLVDTDQGGANTLLALDATRPLLFTPLGAVPS